MRGFSALQRAEIAEMPKAARVLEALVGFSALQRAEIAEMKKCRSEPRWKRSFSALQRAEIAEIDLDYRSAFLAPEFQCSSTSRNC